MDDDVATVRRFNRLVTQRVGALQDEYLSRTHPLGTSRVLWEIGRDGADVRNLRSRLDLDSGYLSRILRGLENEGMIRTKPADHDQRVRVAELTPAGRAEWSELDRRSDDLASDLLTPLTDEQRRRLVSAMETVERLLTAGLVIIAPEPLSSPDAQWCLRNYFDELDRRFDTGFDPGVGAVRDVSDLAAPHGLLLLARLHGEPVGIGGLTFHDDGTAEIKRLWVGDAARGLGVGRRIVTELERHARENGASAARLDTNGALTEAMALYRSAGYVEIPRYNDNPYAHHWFEKVLVESKGSATK